MISYEVLFLKSLGYTIAIETIVLFLIAQLFSRKILIKPSMVAFLGILCSLATLPYLWFILPRFIESKITYHIVAELTALFAESLIYFGVLKCKYSQALLISLACNGVSYLSGLIFNIA